MIGSSAIRRSRNRASVLPATQRRCRVPRKKRAAFFAPLVFGANFEMGYFPGFEEAPEDAPALEPLPGLAAEYPASVELGSGDVPEVPCGPACDEVLPLPVPEFVDVPLRLLLFARELSVLPADPGALPGCAVMDPVRAPFELPALDDEPAVCPIAKGLRLTKRAGTSKKVSLFFM